MKKAVKKTYIRKSNKDWWDEISEGEKSSIERGMKELKEGKGIPHKEVMNRYPQWFLNNRQLGWGQGS